MGGFSKLRSSESFSFLDLGGPHSLLPVHLDCGSSRLTTQQSLDYSLTTRIHKMKSTIDLVHHSSSLTLLSTIANIVQR